MADQLVASIPSFTEARRGFGEGRGSPREYLEACLDAIERAEPVLKAFVALDADGARAAADQASARYREGRPHSPIDGMVVGVKDIVDTADMPTGMNSPIFEGQIAKGDAAAVWAVRKGGGVIIGKTVATEFAIGRSGPTLNPHNTAHTPGGSSSGSAAGAAAGFFSAAFGTQTQGSIIRPSGFCGVVGFKPTLHALSTDGVHSLSRTHDHLGTIGADLDDVWALARWVSELAPQQSYPGLDGPVEGPLPEQALTRVAVLRTAGFDEFDEEMTTAFEGALDRLRTRSVQIVNPEDDPALAEVVAELDSVNDRSQDVLAWDMRWPFMGYIRQHPDKLGPRLHELMDRAARLNRADYRRHLAFRAGLQAKVAALRDAYDAFVLPSSSEPAPEGLGYTGRRTMLVYWSFLGLPAFGLPLMTVRNLPVGFQLAGFANSDYRLARHAKWLISDRAA